VFFFGLPGDVPVMGDWNGDGRLKAGVYRNGAWFVDWNGNNQWDAIDVAHVFFFGLPGDVPVTGDWNGDGRLKAGVYRNGAWFVDWNGNNQWDATDAAHVFLFGLPGDRPVMGPWNATQQNSSVTSSRLPMSTIASADESPREADVRHHPAGFRSTSPQIEVNAEHRAAMQLMQRQREDVVHDAELHQCISTMQHDVDEIMSKPEVQNEFRRMEQEFKQVEQRLESQASK
jgi:hypothetical protein